MTNDLREFQYAYDTTLGVPATRIVPVHSTRGNEPAPNQRLRLGEALVESDVITPKQLEHCLREQERSAPRRRLGALVVQLGLATDEDVARGLATILGFEYVEPATLEVPKDVVRRVPRLTAEMLGVVPIGAGETWLRIAVADPTDRLMLDTLRESTGLLTVSMAVATPSGIEEALHRFWASDYEPVVVEVEPEPEPEPEEQPQPDEEPEPEPAAVEGGWEYLMVGDALPTSHRGYTGDLVGTERELARLGAEGWEAVGVSTNGSRMTVLLKRARG